MFSFFTLFGIISLLHGGVPAFLFFCIFFSLSLCCAKKCENCRCCSRSCGRKKWESKHNIADTQEMMATTITATDGENSKERKESVSAESVSIPAEETPKVSKSGHIRVNSVDLDDVDIEADVTQI